MRIIIWIQKVFVNGVFDSQPTLEYYSIPLSPLRCHLKMILVSFYRNTFESVCMNRVLRLLRAVSRGGRKLKAKTLAALLNPSHSQSDCVKVSVVCKLLPVHWAEAATCKVPETTGMKCHRVLSTVNVICCFLGNSALSGMMTSLEHLCSCNTERRTWVICVFLKSLCHVSDLYIFQ